MSSLQDKRAGAWTLCVWFLVATCLASTAAQAQESAEPSDGDIAQMQIDLRDVLSWEDGPTTAVLGGIAEVDVPAGYSFLAREDTRRLLELYQNELTDREMGLIAQSDDLTGWFVVFEFDPVGYVQDDERETLDAQAILSTLQASAQQHNAARESMGYSAIDVLGWKIEPEYDSETKNLQWCVRCQSDGLPIFNHNVRVLGRRGVMEVTLVCDPEDFDVAQRQMRDLVAGFSYTGGNRYGDWRAGDKMASYGLTALVAGGGLALAAKSGLLKKLLKPLLLAVIVVGSAIGKFFKNLFGRRESLLS